MLLLLLGFVASLNYLVDPYGLFGTARISSFNKNKPTASTRVRLVKPYEVVRVKPSTIIVGNSRPEMGLNPNHLCWSVGQQPVYSLTIPGASMYMQMRYTQHALAATSPKLILLGLDFIDFLVDSENNRDPYEWPFKPKEFESRLLVTATGNKNDQYYRQFFEDHFLSSFSFNALTDSVKTLAFQRSPNASTRTELGFNPANDYRDIVRSEGQEVLFRQKNKQVIATFISRNWSIYHAEYSWSHDFEVLKRFIEMSKKNHAKLILFINPYHAHYLESIRQAGLWSLFERWKRVVVQLASHQENISLWDFSGFDDYSTEIEPAVGDLTNTMDWFWEPAHYRAELGDLMIASMLKDSCGAAIGEQFGVLISAENIDQHLLQLRTNSQRYVADNPLVVKHINELITLAKQ
ncbi:MAG: hypothetical protein GXP08_08210 [Gammaproteobacteria bacterium]|nr:hypothetical protein [Gammaproteobacteria bacterium]